MTRSAKPTRATEVRCQQSESETERHHGGEYRVAYPSEHAGAHQRGRLALVDADPPRVTHVELGVDGGGDTDHRDHGTGDLDPGRVQEAHRRHHAEQLQDRARRSPQPSTTTNPAPADHSIEPGRPLMPWNPVDPVRRRCTQLRQPNPSAANTAKSAIATMGMSGSFLNVHEQHGSPRHALTPSRTAIAAMPSAATGSAHDQPSTLLSTRPASRIADR